MKTITGTTFNFLKNQYEYHVHEFLDDPDGMCMPDTSVVKPGDKDWEPALAKEIVAHYRELCVIGPDCETTFWAVALAEGTPYERNRLVEYLLAGGVTDLPAEVLPDATKAT